MVQYRNVKHMTCRACSGANVLHMPSSQIWRLSLGPAMRQQPDARAGSKDCESRLRLLSWSVHLAGGSGFCKSHAG